MQNYPWEGGTHLIYKATPNGSSTKWVADDGNANSGTAIEAPVFRMLVDGTDPKSQHLLAGTAAGLYASTDGGADWTPYNNSIIPQVPVLDLQQNSAGQIFVATHGAGAYKLSVPSFANSKVFETENQKTCSPYNLSLSVSPPPGVRNGDVLIVDLSVGAATGSPPTLPQGWVFLGDQNSGGSTAGLLSTGSCGFFAVSWLAAHVYSTNDTTPYVFPSVSITPPTDTCAPQYCWTGEFGAAEVSYRGAADPTAVPYTAYGYPNSDSSTESVGPVNVAASRMLLNLFSGVSENESGEGGKCDTFTAPTGSPPLVVETTSTACPVGASRFLAADVWSGPGGSFGAYSTSPSGAANNPSPLAAWSVVIPPAP